MKTIGGLCAAILVLAAAGAKAAAIPPAPPAPMGNTSEVVQGVTVADPYRGLENPNDPKVQAWSDAQNARTRAYLDALPDRAGAKNELTKLVTATSPSYSELTARGRPDENEGA